MQFAKFMVNDSKICAWDLDFMNLVLNSNHSNSSWSFVKYAVRNCIVFLWRRLPCWHMVYGGNGMNAGGRAIHGRRSRAFTSSHKQSRAKFFFPVLLPFLDGQQALPLHSVMHHVSAQDFPIGKFKIGCSTFWKISQDCGELQLYWCLVCVDLYC